jgi:NAD/NADP transhydrogenase beta subunit
MDPVSHTVINLIIFVLAIYVGYHVVWTVTPALHTPLMAVTNAISAIVIVGAMLAAALTKPGLGKTMGVLAVTLAAVNVFGGFLVTRRMLEMFKKKEKKTAVPKAEEGAPSEHEPRHAAVPGGQRLLHPGPEGPEPSHHVHPRQRLRHDGMAIAVLTTIALIHGQARSLNVDFGTGMAYVLAAVVVGGGLGAFMANKVEMTKMPELVAFMHSMIGLAAVFIARGRRGRALGLRHHAAPVAAIIGANTPDGAVLLDGFVRYAIPYGNRLELFLGAAIGAVTFSGSVIAFGKLSGKYKFRLFQGAPVQFKGQHMLNLVLGLLTVALGLLFVATESWGAFFAMLALAFVMGVLIIIPIGGADMPVVVSMLNSYSGWAAAGIGFSLNNAMLIVAGSLVGSSGAILSYIMCKAMNRSFFNVILGGFGGEAATATGGAKEQRPVKTGSADDAAFVLGNAETVVIVPGYGLAVARAQHAVKELAAKLTEKGIT